MIDDDFTFPVYINEKTLEEIKKISKKNDLEVFGYLVGERFNWKGKNYVIIENHLYLEGAVHSDKYSFSLMEGTRGKYEIEFQKLKRKNNNENLLRVGWWHSHPGFGCFLSEVDLITQEVVFYEPYHVALVVDPKKDTFNFFTLDKNSKDGYKPLSYAIISSA